MSKKEIKKQRDYLWQAGPEISSRPIVRDDHTKRPDDHENNYSRPVDDHVYLENLSQFLWNRFCLHLSKYNRATNQSIFTCCFGVNSSFFIMSVHVRYCIISIEIQCTSTHNYVLERSYTLWWKWVGIWWGWRGGRIDWSTDWKICLKENVFY